MSGRRFAFFILLLAGAAGVARGQYYDEKMEPRDRFRSLSLGGMWREFAPRPTNPLADSTALRFTRVMPLLAFRQGMVEIFFGYTPFGEGNDQSAVMLGTTVAMEVPLADARTSVLSLPVQLAADFTKVTGRGPQRDDFNIGSVGIGAGVKYRWTSPGVEAWVQGVETIHVSFEGFAVGTGSSTATTAEAGVFLREIGIAEGVVIIYRFRMQTWRIGGGRFDYRTTMHGPSIGICF